MMLFEEIPMAAPSKTLIAKPVENTNSRVRSAMDTMVQD